MKKVIVAVMAVLCLGLVSCNKCTCTVTSMGVTKKYTYTEKEIQDAGVKTCAEMDSYLKIADGFVDDNLFNASCK